MKARIEMSWGSPRSRPGGVAARSVLTGENAGACKYQLVSSDVQAIVMINSGDGVKRCLMTCIYIYMYTINRMMQTNNDQF